MPYGIKQYLDAGVPADVFALTLHYYQVGSGKLHWYEDCTGRSWQTKQLVSRPALTLRDQDLCRRCATDVPKLDMSIWGRPTVQHLLDALDAAKTFTDCHPLLTGDDPDLTQLYAVQHRLQRHAASRGDAVINEASRLLAAARARTADVLTRVEPDRSAWCASLRIDDVVTPLTGQDRRAQLGARRASNPDRDQIVLVSEITNDQRILERPHPDGATAALAPSRLRAQTARSVIARIPDHVVSYLTELPEVSGREHVYAGWGRGPALAVDVLGQPADSDTVDTLTVALSLATQLPLEQLLTAARGITTPAAA